MYLFYFAGPIYMGVVADACVEGRADDDAANECAVVDGEEEEEEEEE
jgi:hypothetical protein